MKKGFLLNLLMLLMVSMGGVISASAQNVTTYTFSSKSWAADNGDWTSGKDGNQFNKSQGVQITTGYSGANATSPTSFTDVTKVVVVYSTNAKKGTGAIKIQVGNNAEMSESITPVGTSDTELEFTCNEAQSGNVKITVTCSDNSIYVKSIAITASAGGSTLEDPQISYPVSEFTYDFNNASSFPVLTIGSYDGTITYKSSNTKVATVDDNGEVTPVDNGTSTITATWPATEKYSGGSASYTLTVENKPFEIEDGVFDFSKGNYGSGAEQITEGSAYAENATTWTAVNVTMVADGKYRWWTGSSLRFYAKDDTHDAGSISFSVPEGKVITSIDFGVTASSLTPSVGNISSKSWSGMAQNVSFEYNGSKGSINLSKVTVTYGDIPTVSVTVGETGFATLTSDIALDFSASEIKAYKAAVSGENITLTQVQKVAAGEGVLVYYAGGKTEDIPATTETVELLSDNAFVGTLERIPWLESEEGSKKNYILNVGEKGIGFYLASRQEVPAGKAYLQIPATSGAKQFFTLNMNDAVVTGINEVKAAKGDNAIYNLNGVRVKEITQKGVYIVNGKKVVVK